MHFFLVSRTGGTGCVLAFSCCHAEWWFILQRKPPSTSTTTGRMGGCTLLLLGFVHVQCPSMRIVEGCNSGSKPWGDLKHWGNLGVSSLWEGWTPRRHHLVVKSANWISIPQPKLPRTTANILKNSAGWLTLTDYISHILIRILWWMTPLLAIWQSLFLE